jgi:hypothetical protein
MLILDVFGILGALGIGFVVGHTIGSRETKFYREEADRLARELSMRVLRGEIKT